MQRQQAKRQIQQRVKEIIGDTERRLSQTSNQHDSLGQAELQTLHHHLSFENDKLFPAQNDKFAPVQNDTQSPNINNHLNLKRDSQNDLASNRSNQPASQQQSSLDIRQLYLNPNFQKNQNQAESDSKSKFSVENVKLNNSNSQRRKWD